MKKFMIANIWIYAIIALLLWFLKGHTQQVKKIGGKIL